jgi:type II secretory pathway component GspD/PulD (secretin)
MNRPQSLVTICALGVCLSVFAASSAAGQDAEPTTNRSGQTITVVQQGSSTPRVVPSSPGGPIKIISGQQVPPGALPPGAKPPNMPGQPPTKGDPQGKGDGPSKPSGAPDADSAKPSATIKRADKTPEAADPKEFDVRPGPDGVVRFQFRGQNWPDVLQWYAEIAGKSVDWQELPGDYLNISTQRGYRVEELGDLLNRLLLARGFTMLPQDEFINVVKCEDLSAALVPRVQPEDLESLGEFDFVRVMFDLDWMLAEATTTELEPLLSKNGKVYALKATNRVEVMDAVCNLREIRRLLQEEQQVEDGQPRLVQEFVLQYARAEEVRQSLSEFLGVSTSRAPMMPGMSPQQLAKQQQAMMQMQAQMQQMAARQSASRSSSSSSRSRTAPKVPAKEAPVRMMVNTRRNSLIVQAPPDKMATIAQAVKLLDVAEAGAGSLQAFLGRMQVYRMASLDPQKLVESLESLGGLDPTTRLEVDETNRAIIAYASPADHHTIRMTVEKLDGSARRVEVIPLRKLAADEVAGTIKYLMGGTEEKESSSYSRRYYDPWSYSSRRSSNDKQNDEFRVEADVVNNRLLVRANEVELEEVVSILVKLGEVPRLDGSGDMTRVLDIAPGDQTADFLNRLQRDFEVLAPNQLILPQIADPDDADVPESKGSKPAASSADSPEEKEASAEGQGGRDTAETQTTRPLNRSAQEGDKTTAMPQVFYRTALFESGDESTADNQVEPNAEVRSAPPPALQRAFPNRRGEGGKPAPIVVSIGPDGRIVLSSRDTRALDVLEDLATRTAPPSKDYEVFTLQYAPASWIVLNLEDFFEDEDEAEQRRRDRTSWLFGMPSGASSDDERRLSNRKPLKFISDLDTNTILVQNADAQQLKIIADLIELYDVPEPVSSQKARVTKLFTIRYSRASIVATTIKDAYRDLLSSNDRALQSGGKEQAKQPRGGGMTVISAFGLGGEQPPADNRTSARFEGKLSIGVDELSNTLLVSTEGENLMSVVADMIEALDEAARPVSEVRVVQVGRHVDGSRLKEALDKVLREQSARGQTRPAGAPNAPGPQQPGGGRPPQGLAAPAAAKSRN